MDIQNRLVATKERKAGRGKFWEFGVIYMMDKQQSPTVQHREPYSLSCDKL